MRKPFSKTDWRLVTIRNKRLLDDFVEYQTTKTPASVRTYKGTLELWFVFLLWSGKNRIHTKIPPYMVKRFAAWLETQGEAASTIKSRLSAISALNKYIVEERAEDFPFFIKRFKKGANENGKKDKTERPYEPGAVGSVQPGEHPSPQ